VTAVLNVLLPIVAGVCLLLAILLVGRALHARARIPHLAYGVGRQEARQAMQINIIRSIGMFIVGLILLAVWALTSQPGSATPAPTLTPAALEAEATATTSPPATITPTATPTLALPTSASEPEVAPPTATFTPMPTATPTAPPPTARVTSGVGVWLRVAPSAQAEQLERIDDGVLLILLPGRTTADEFEWQEVRAPSGNEGWVAVPFITYNQP
jgi:hypothetical protein